MTTRSLLIGSAILGFLVLASLQPPGRVLLSPSAFAGEQEPQQQDTPTLQRRAYEALNREQYARALPLYEELARRLKNSPDELQPVEERIRVCRRNLASAPATAQAAPARHPHAPLKPGEVREMGIRDLGNFDYDYEKGGTIPDDVRRLSGGVLRLKGFMISGEEADKVSHFALVPSLFSCCYGQPPGVQHVIAVTCPRGLRVPFSSEQVLVEGVLTVREIREDNYVVSLFQMSCTSVKPAAR